MLKTFWGWRDRQLPDGTVIWALPGECAYVTTPGGALLSPALCVPTGDLPARGNGGAERCGERAAMMPLRATTRAQHRAARTATERHHNRRARTAPSAECFTYTGPAPPDNDDDPPPF